MLIFSFGPVQPFIAEARRASDLFAGSQILAHLARAAARRLETSGRLIFPAGSGDDAPNRIVAVVPWAEAETAATEARDALLTAWSELVDDARRELQRRGPAVDANWDAIWERQTATLWETFWAVARIDAGGYGAAYDAASRALDAAKRTRAFARADEPGIKDSLGGRRQALRTERLDAPAYWAQTSQRFGASRVRPGGRERLDAIGAVKRFSEPGRRRFPSVSWVAAGDFIAAAGESLAAYRREVETLLGTDLYEVAEGAWPYDGGLLYPEGLTPTRLAENYGVDPEFLDPARLRATETALRALYRAVGWAPSPYVAVVALDGDSMGEQVSHRLTADDPESAHRELSRRLAAFAGEARSLVEQARGRAIYAGGDDVLALAPLSTALGMARALAERFEAITGATASAGVAINHQRFPLNAALASAREAEASAKRLPGKAAVCLLVRRHSGETQELRSPWQAAGETFQDAIDLFRSGTLASGFAGSVASSAYGLPTADGRFESELRRLVRRHRAPGSDRPDPAAWAGELCRWSEALPGGTDELGRWLGFARFVAQGGAS